MANYLKSKNQIELNESCDYTEFIIEINVFKAEFVSRLRRSIYSSRLETQSHKNRSESRLEAPKKDGNEMACFYFCYK